MILCSLHLAETFCDDAVPFYVIVLNTEERKTQLRLTRQLQNRIPILKNKDRLTKCFLSNLQTAVFISFLQRCPTDLIPHYFSCIRDSFSLGPQTRLPTGHRLSPIVQFTIAHKQPQGPRHYRFTVILFNMKKLSKRI